MILSRLLEHDLTWPRQENGSVSKETAQAKQLVSGIPEPMQNSGRCDYQPAILVHGRLETGHPQYRMAD